MIVFQARVGYVESLTTNYNDDVKSISDDQWWGNSPRGSWCRMMTGTQTTPHPPGWLSLLCVWWWFERILLDCCFFVVEETEEDKLIWWYQTSSRRQEMRLNRDRTDINCWLVDAPTAVCPFFHLYDRVLMPTSTAPSPQGFVSIACAIFFVCILQLF